MGLDPGELEVRGLEVRGLRGLRLRLRGVSAAV